MVEQLKAASYQTDLQYAENDIPNQLAQVKNMIANGVGVLQATNLVNGLKEGYTSCTLNLVDILENLL